MDKDAALLMVAKDLFLEAMKLKPALKKQYESQVQAKGRELDLIASEFIAFHEKLKPLLKA